MFARKLSRILVKNEGIRLMTLPRYCSGKRDIKELLAAYPGGSVDLDKDDAKGIAKILINNPEKKNAFSGKMMLDFADCVSELEKWEKGRALLVYGADNTFCSGGDLDLMKALLEEPEGGARMSAFMHDTLLRLRRLPMVSAAFMQGRALGGGAEVATACDIRLVTERVSIGFVQKKMGLVCGWGSGTRLVQLLGRTLALELLVTGKVFGWKEAVDMNFVDGVIHESDSAIDNAEVWLEKWTSGDTKVIRATKHLISQIADYDMEIALSRENKVFDSVWGGDAQKTALDSGLKHK